MYHMTISDCFFRVSLFSIRHRDINLKHNHVRQNYTVVMWIKLILILIIMWLNYINVNTFSNQRKDSLTLLTINNSLIIASKLCIILPDSMFNAAAHGLAHLQHVCNYFLLFSKVFYFNRRKVNIKKWRIKQEV